MKRPQFTLFQMMVATAVIAVLLATLPNASKGLVTLLACLTIPLLAVTLLYFWFESVPYRIRLPVEITTMLAMLALSTKIWAPRYDNSRSAAEVSIIASNLADAVDSPVERDHYRRIAVRFAGKARALRWRALWMGLTWGPYGYHMPMSGRDLIEDFELLEMRERLEADWQNNREQMTRKR